jgi:uncharacterized lipoprotein YmbA
MMRTMLLIAVISGLGLLGGCSTSPKANFYTLDPTTLTRTDAPVQVAVLVGPVSVPEFVDRPQIVTRAAGNEVEIDEFARWAAPLRVDIARVMAADLSSLLGSDLVSSSDAGWDTDKVWRVRVNIVRFDSALGDAVTIETLWAVRPPGKTDFVAGRSLKREAVDGKGYPALVAAHDRALAAVSKDIATAIRANLSQ